MNRKLRANRSLAHFAVLVVFGVAVTLFLINKANQVIADLSELEQVWNIDEI